MENEKSIDDEIVVVVILNYNTWNETVDCMNSIRKNLFNANILVVDNCSPVAPTSRFLEFVNSDDMVEVIYAEKNSGYSAGNNIGIKRALDMGANYIFISNSDIILQQNAMKEMIELTKNIDDCGIVGPQIYNREGKFVPFLICTKLDFWGKLKNMGLKLWPLRYFLKEFEKAFVIKEEIIEPVKVFGVHGSFFLLTRECADFLHPLDERSFLYEEEYIIGCEIENTNFNAYLCPKAKVNHLEGVSTEGMSAFAFECMTNSEQLYLNDYIKVPIWQRCIIFCIRRMQYVFKCLYNQKYREYLMNYMRNTKKYNISLK